MIHGFKSRPLWQLLILANDNKNSLHLSCNECFALLEYDADLLAAGADPDKLQAVIEQHLQLCSECRAETDRWREISRGNRN